MLDTAAIAKKMGQASTGSPLVADVERQKRADAVQEKLLDALATLSNTIAQPPSVVVPDAPAPQIVVQPAQPQRGAWVFEFSRNPDGTIKSVTANPI